MPGCITLGCSWWAFPGHSLPGLWASVHNPNRGSNAYNGGNITRGEASCHRRCNAHLPAKGSKGTKRGATASRWDDQI